MRKMILNGKFSNWVSGPMSENAMFSKISTVALLARGLAPSFWKVKSGSINLFPSIFTISNTCAINSENSASNYVFWGKITMSVTPFLKMILVMKIDY